MSLAHSTTTEATHRFWQPAAERTRQSGLALTAAPPAPLALTERYRPTHLADLVGQGAVVNVLASYLEAPYPAAFLFHGYTGTGKTSAALALATELGVNVDWSLHRISSGAMDAEAVEATLKLLRFSAPNGGWRLVVVDEADSMSAKAKTLWLSILEDLPGRAVIVFTTNHLERFESRFVDRCECLAFASDARMLEQDAQTLIEWIWICEKIAGLPPDVGDLPGLVEKGALSFRRVVQAISAFRHGARPAPVPATIPLAEKRRQAARKAAATRKARKGVAL